MSRKNNKREPPQKWECNSDHERFVRIFESMFESPALRLLEALGFIVREPGNLMREPTVYHSSIDKMEKRHYNSE